jgi:RNA polymerase sigma-70 factor, ECF subfamily
MNVGKPTSGSSPPHSIGEVVGRQDEHFLTLYTAAYPRIYAYVFSLLPNRDNARDAMQETSLVLLQRFGDFQFGPQEKKSELEMFIRWGCGIALNQVRRLRRKQVQTLQYSEQVLDRIAATREQYSELLELRRRFLPECLKRLSDVDRDLVFRCFCQTTSIRLVAEQMNRPANTLYKAINRIRATLKECIDLAVRQEERK